MACIDGWKNRDGGYAFGGTCLNAGCIPSKALLESSELFHRAGHEFKTHGIGVGTLQLDVAAMQKRKDGIVKGMTGGIASLFKSAMASRPSRATASCCAGNQVEYTAADGSKQVLEAGHGDPGFGFGAYRAQDACLWTASTSWIPGARSNSMPCRRASA